MSDLPDIHDALFRLGDELAMEPDDWIDKLLASGALVEVAIDYEPVARKMYHRATMGTPPNWAKADQGFWLDEARRAIAVAIG